MSAYTEPNKVGLAGTGMVGASPAHAWVPHGMADESALIDADGARAHGERMDLDHGLPFVRPMRIIAGDYADLSDAGAERNRAGTCRRPRRTRLERLRTGTGLLLRVRPNWGPARLQPRR